MKRAFMILTAFSTVTAFTAAALAADTVVEPLYTKSAQRVSGLVFDAYVSHYQGRGFEEIDDVDATELRIDLTVPISARGQLRLSLPFHTDGDGRRIENGKSTAIDGNGGTFDFASATYEHQFMDVAEDKFNLMAYAGLGFRADKLDTSHGDYMNHRGSLARAGVRMDRAVSSSMSLSSDIGYQHYWDTDDLDPSGENRVSFGHLLVSVAVMKHDLALKPALELTYRGDLVDYNNFQIIPELIYSFKSVDLKIGVPVGLSSDADDYGVTLGFTYRM